MVTGTAAEPAALSQPPWLSVKQKSRRWFWPGSFVRASMGALIKTVQLTEGVWRPSPFLEVSYTCSLSMEDVPKVNFCLDLILINDTQELQTDQFIYKKFRSVEMIQVSHSLNECAKQHFWLVTETQKLLLHLRFITSEVQSEPWLTRDGARCEKMCEGVCISPPLFMKCWCQAHLNDFYFTWCVFTRSVTAAIDRFLKTLSKVNGWEKWWCALLMWII